MCVIEFLNINGYELKYGDSDKNDHKFAKLINEVAASSKGENDIELFIESGAELEKLNRRFKLNELRRKTC